MRGLFDKTHVLRDYARTAYGHFSNYLESIMPTTKDLPLIAVTVVASLAAVYAVNHFMGNILIKKTA